MPIRATDDRPPAFASAADQSSVARQWWALAGVLAIAGAAVWIYLPSIHGKFFLDDVSLAINNPIITSSDGLYRVWYTAEQPEYFPISYSTFWLERRLWGIDPTGYHATNVAAHIAVSLLIWLTLRRLCVPGAFLAALVFCVHPVNVETVASTFHLRGLLASVFFLLSILCYLRDIEQRTMDDGPQTRRWYWLSVFTFVLAMLSKGTVAILPLVLLLVVWWQRRQITRWDWARVAPFFLAAAVLTLVNIWFTIHRTGEVLRSVSVTERLNGAGAAMWFYLSKALLPINLSLFYPHWDMRTWDPLWWLPIAAVLGVTAALWGRRNGPQASCDRSLVFAWSFFGVALIPVLGFADTVAMSFSLVADRYQYLAMIGVVAFVAAGWRYCCASVAAPARWPVNALAVVVVAGLSLLAWQQSRLFGDVVTLYEATLKKNPDCWLAHYNLGVEIDQTGDVRQALVHYQKAVALKPDFIEARNNLGIALVKVGRIDEAIEYFRTSLQLQPHRPATHFNLGNALAAANRPQEAAEQYRQAVELKSDYAEAWANLAAAHGDMQQWDDALSAANMASELARAQGLSELERSIAAWKSAIERRPK